MIDLMGGSATPMAFGEVYTGLQQGVIDGAESNETALTTNKHGEVAKHFSYNQHTIVPDLTIMNSKLYNKLTEKQKEAITQAAIESTEYHKKLWNESIENAVNCIILCLFPPCNPHSKGIAFHLSIYPARRAAHRHRRTNAAPLAAVNSSR